MTEQRFKSFAEFWPYYVREHSLPGTRALHAIGTLVGTGCALALISRGKWRWLALAMVPGYGAAWLAHYLIERNKPATFKHPLWSLMGDYKMLAMMAAGTMNTEVEKALAADKRLP